MTCLAVSSHTKASRSLLASRVLSRSVFQDMAVLPSMVLHSKPPLPDPHVLSSLVCSLFPFKELDCRNVTRLQSYDDRNLFFNGRPENSCLQALSKLRSENGFVAKIFRRRSSSEGQQELEGQLMAAEFAVRKGCNCPQPIRSRRGNILEEVNTTQLSPEETVAQGNCIGSYYLSIVSFIPGVTISKVRKTPQVLKEYGRAIGKLNYALKDFEHAAIRQRNLEAWNLKYFMKLQKHLDQCTVEPQLMESLLKVFNDFDTFLTPRIPHLFSGILHSDVNDCNVICSVQESGSCDTTKPFGIIDFGDCMHGPYVFELGIAVAYELLGKEEPLKEVTPVVEGFIEEFPLPKRELSLVFYVAMARLAQSYINAQLSLARDPDNAEYLSVHSVPAKRLLCDLAFLPKELAQSAWTSVFPDN